jgi:hypothetical protein
METIQRRQRFSLGEHYFRINIESLIFSMSNGDQIIANSEQQQQLKNTERHHHTNAG